MVGLSEDASSQSLEPDAHLLTFGETMGVFIADQVGDLGTVRSFGLGIGGAESNVAMTVARLGGRASWIGRVGADATGDLVERLLRASGVVTKAIRGGSYTGIMVRHRPSGALTQVEYHRAGSEGSHLGPSDIEEHEVREAGIVHITGITPALSTSARAAIFSALETATSAGVLISMDVNYRARLWSPETARPVLCDLARRADILLAGPDEARLLLDSHARDPIGLADGLASLGAAEVIIKDAGRGCTARIDGSILVEPALPAAVVDPVGAGDAFVGGYIAERLRGAPPEKRLRQANAAGAFAVGVPGDCMSTPSPAVLTALLDWRAEPEVLR